MSIEILPDLRLRLAILERAFCDLAKKKQVNIKMPRNGRSINENKAASLMKHRNRESAIFRKEAYLWFVDNRDKSMSFIDLCNTLNLNYEIVRKIAIKYYETDKDFDGFKTNLTSCLYACVPELIDKDEFPSITRYKMRKDK